MGLPQTPSEAAKALKKYGQQQYIRGDYEAALTAFDEVIVTDAPAALGLSDSGDMATLDHRAATLCKLGRTQKALEDGRRMIKLDKNDHRGYLRTASVLRTMKKPEKALEIFHYALKTLSEQSPFYKKDVQKAERNLSTALYGPRTLDPCGMFPFEVMRMIFLQLTVKDRIVLRRVSKSWNSLCQSMPEMYRDLDLRLASKRKRVTAKSVLAFLKLSGNSPTRATLARLSVAELKKCLTYLSRCKTLEELYLNNAVASRCDILHTSDFSSLRTLKTSSEFVMSPTDMRKLCGSLPQLEHVEVWLKASFRDTTILDFPAPMKNLSSLTIGATNDHIFEVPEESTEYSIGTRFPRLEEINFVEMAFADFPDLLTCTTLRRVGFLACDTNDSPRLSLPDSVEHLSLSRTPGTIAFIDWYPQNLKSFIWNDAQRPGDDILEWVLMDFSENLLYVDLENCWDPSLCELLHDSIRNGCLSSVTDLNLARIPLVNNETVNLITKHMPNLKRLNISVTQTDASAIRMLVNAEDMKLERLVCHGLLIDRSYHNAVTAARNHGIDIPVVKTSVPSSQSPRTCPL
ncbi:hypothetical protein KEM56_000094 [Ascosphaera pollenicola]|nr:hypothetical protein KEM56_000094 [Ascosphaera pollenicola]